MSNTLNNRTAAVVDVILSNHARGYRNSEMISHYLFPRAMIGNRSMRVIRFGKEGFRMVNTRRAPGANIETIQYGYASDSVSLVQDSLQGLVPVEHQEEAAKVPGVNLGSNAVSMVMKQMDLGLEFASAKLARDANSYDDNHKLALTGTDKWSDPNSDPEADIDDAKEEIRRMIGQYPNVLALGAPVFKVLKRHPKIKDQFKYTTSQSITKEMLASYFDVDKVVVGKAVYLPQDAKDDDPASDVWGNDAVLAWVPDETTGNFQVPSFGYTYELTGYPQVEQPWYDRDRRSWKYPTTTERQAVLTGSEAGFLFKGAI